MYRARATEMNISQCRRYLVKIAHVGAICGRESGIGSAVTLLVRPPLATLSATPSISAFTDFTPDVCFSEISGPGLGGTGSGAPMIVSVSPHLR